MTTYIEDQIGLVVAAMRDPDSADPLAPYYMIGHPLEIANRLKEKDQDKVYKYQKYPLIALRLDIPEPSKGGLTFYNLNIAILDYNDPKWNSEERLENKFKPVLVPLYLSFIEKLASVGKFSWDMTQDIPPHTPIRRYFWGTETKEGNTAYIFDDPLDAIEIIDLKISKKISNC